jgi:hypothetical protein
VAVAVGPALTTTVVEAALAHPLALVTVRVYEPALMMAALVMEGLWRDDVNPLGPVQAYVVIPPIPPVSWIVCPTQYGPAFAAVAVGPALTTTVVEAALAQPLALVTVSVYEPPLTSAAFVMDGL